MRHGTAIAAVRHALFALIVSALAACATRPSSDPVASDVGVVYDKYAAEWVVTGDKIPQQSLWSLEAMMSTKLSAVRLRGTFDDSLQKKKFQLYIISAGQGAFGFIVVGASDSNGTPLQTHRVENTSVQMTITGPVMAPLEVMAIDLTREYLNAHKANGLDIKLTGYNNGSMIVKMPAADLNAFLQQYDAALAQHKK